MDKIKKAIKSTFRLFGLDISKVNLAPPIVKENMPPTSFQHHQIDLLLDVGANIGQFALNVRQQGYKNTIVSFEPLLDAHQILTEAAKNDSSWIIHERSAIGSKIGEAEINISNNSFSSSLLPMLDAHAIAAPDSIYVGKQTTKIITLDSVFNNYFKKNDKVFLKIDTQGFEKEVLDGAKDCLEHIMCVQLELSIVSLYESQQLYEYFFNFFKSNGFILWSLIPGFGDPKTGQLLQFDAVFSRQ